MCKKKSVDKNKKEVRKGGGAANTRGIIRASHPAASGSILRVPESVFENLSEKIIQCFRDLVMALLRGKWIEAR